MDTLHLVDPELRPLLDVFPRVELSPENFAAMRAREIPLPPVDRTTTTLDILTVPGPDGAPDVRMHVYRPIGATGPLPCIYHIHGGGYVGGSAAEIEPLHRPLAAELGCAIVSVDYRLAPETIFPGAIEDCYAGLAWTFGHAGDLGIDSTRIGVMGESAGGGLAAALALMTRDRGDYPLAFQHLIYPMIDDRTCVREPHPTAGEFIWHAHNNAFGWTALLGHEPGIDGVSPYAAASRATDLTGLPRTYISTGALDLFVDEDIDYAQRLNRAGVPIELHVYPGGYHGFDFFAAAPVSLQARRDSNAGLARALAA
ncbi:MULTISPECIES: alpha/beta hydrolase [unclassified Sphingomonas]|uniref:alpha/beta hydrolase n=1 Tax=unclassified Sphingomonas TaxID=196159 RepID=UPI00226A5E60|nr:MULTISPECIES: alpha/beta hydrolase [unclassified Sphingomonas]